MKKSKIIFIVGGIFSGIGKGIVLSSIGNFFKRRGAKIGIIKLDPYLNLGAGRLSPSEHGEVFVTKDGEETDLDLGNYERFLDQDTNKNSFKTLGNVLYKVLEKEKNFGFKGKTIDFKDVRDEVYEEIVAYEARYSPDILLIEVGGKVSDFNIRPFMEAGQKLRNERGKKWISFFFLTFLSFFEKSKEFKIGSAKNSLSLIRSFGIEPDFVCFRTQKSFLPDEILEKFSNDTGVALDVCAKLPELSDHYELPLFLTKQKFFEKIIEWVNIDLKKPRADDNWAEFLRQNNLLKKSKNEINIGVAIKYYSFESCYKSVYESINYCAVKLGVKIKINLFKAEEIEKNIEKLEKQDGILIMGGFGIRGFEGKVLACEIARKKNIPLLGICFGLEAGLIEFARNVFGIKNANSREFYEESTQKEQHFINYKDTKNRSMCIGSKEISWSFRDNPVASWLKKRFFKDSNFLETHRHRFALDSKFLSLFEKSDFLPVGLIKDGTASLFVHRNHPFYVCTQGHPEFESRPNNPSPLFLAFATVACKRLKIPLK